VTEHYFAESPRVASHPATIRVTLPGRTLELTTDRGVFAHGQLDRGTELLLRSAPPPPADADVLDFGCGYGPIAVFMALQQPSARVWAVDINERARALSALNAERAGVANITTVDPDGVPPGVRFSVIYSNPPVRLGKEALHALLSTWLARLTPGGAAYLVVQRHLGSDSLATWLESTGFGAHRMRSRQGYRLLEVRPGAAAPHD